jgi:uncharacterized membrane protein YkoI
MNRLKRTGCGFAVAGIALAFSSGAFAYDGEELAKDAKITLNQAEAIALFERRGTLKSQELEHRKDVGKLAYTFTVDSAGKMFDVAVDAMSGDVIMNKPKDGK